MRKRKINKRAGYISVVMSTLLLAGCGTPVKEPTAEVVEEQVTTMGDVIPTESETPIEREATTKGEVPTESKIPAAAADFSKYVYQFANTYMKTANGNETYVFSPYSFCGALGMINNGATGQTREEIETVLGIHDMDSFNTSYQLFSNQNLGNGSTFQTASSIWKDEALEKLTGEDDFSKMCKEYYNADIFNVDFSEDCEEIRRDIQKWVAEKTGNFIPDYKSQIEREHRMSVLNTVYMKGTWKYPFDAASTYEDVFYGIQGDENVSFMKMNGKSLPYYEANGCVAVELPYEDSSLVMRFIMAEDGSTYETWNSMSSEEQIAFLNKLGDSEPRRIKTLSIPKLDYNQKTDNLMEMFQKMGICSLFLPDAGLDNIGEDLYVTTITQQVRLQVDEMGTEAAAVTEILMKDNCVMIEEDGVDFVADKPFLLVLQEKESGTILFMGNVVSIDEQEG